MSAFRIRPITWSGLNKTYSSFQLNGGEDENFVYNYTFDTNLRALPCINNASYQPERTNRLRIVACIVRLFEKQNGKLK